MRGLALLLAGFLLAVAGRAAAQETVLYKCTDAQGNTTLQNNQPCAPGMKQQIRRVGEVRTVPVPQKRADAPPPLPTPVYGEFVLVSGPNMKRAPAPESAGLPPPPPLFQCRTWEGATYYGDVATPTPRCVPIAVTGLDGSPGMGSACEMKPDRCELVPDAQACDAWLRRLDDAEFKATYAREEDRVDRQAAFDAIKAKVEASHCSPVAPAATAP